MTLETRFEEPAQSQMGQFHRFEMPVRWGDLDALNHVNNTVYFRYMEDARVHCMRACGVGGPDTGRNMVLAHISCDFLKPILWPATLLVDTWLTRVGRSSAEFRVEITVQGDESGPCARGRNVLVGVDSATGRSKPWTQDELDGMARMFGTTQTPA